MNPLMRVQIELIPKKAKTRLATAIKSPLRAIALVLMLGLADELYPVLRCTECHHGMPCNALDGRAIGIYL
ncbi:hypothetical protein BDW67DRAFT_149661 [Aspergillus spinulosporus]